MDTLHRKKVEKVKKLEKVKNKKDTLAFILSHFGLISPLMFFCVFFFFRCDGDFVLGKKRHNLSSCLNLNLNYWLLAFNLENALI